MKCSIFWILSIAFFAGCATNAYKEPSESEPHAVFNTNAKLVPVEINGLPRSGMKMSNWSYRLVPGKVQMFVYVQVTPTLRAEGGIEFLAKKGATYEPHIENKLETVRLSIIEKASGHVVAENELRKGTSAGGGMIPIVIPVK